MVWVIGQQGAAGILPANTLKGFRHALSLGVDAVTCDVRLSADGVPVLVQDEQVERASDGPVGVSELTVSALRRLDVGDGQGVPALDELLELVAAGEAKAACVLHERAAALPAADLIRARGLHERVALISDDLVALARIRRHDARLSIGALLSAPTPGRLRRAEALGARAILASCEVVSLRLVAQIHRTSMALVAWGVSTLDEQEAMLCLGVDGIATARPDILLTYLRFRGER